MDDENVFYQDLYKYEKGDKENPPEWIHVKVLVRHYHENEQEEESEKVLYQRKMSGITDFPTINPHLLFYLRMNMKEYVETLQLIADQNVTMRNFAFKSNSSEYIKIGAMKTGNSLSDRSWIEKNIRKDLYQRLDQINYWYDPSYLHDPTKINVTTRMLLDQQEAEVNKIAEGLQRVFKQKLPFCLYRKIAHFCLERTGGYSVWVCMDRFFIKKTPYENPEQDLRPIQQASCLVC